MDTFILASRKINGCSLWMAIQQSRERIFRIHPEIPQIMISLKEAINHVHKDCGTRMVTVVVSLTMKK